MHSLSAGAALAVNAGRRGRRPLQDDIRGGSVCPLARRVPVTLVGADVHIRLPCQAPINHQAKRKRIKKGRPFDTHPEVCAKPPHAGAERSECPSPARAGRRFSSCSRNKFRRPSYLSKPARMCRFCPKRFFLLDRPLRSRWRLCRLRMRRTPCGCGPFVSGLSAAAYAAVGLRHAPAGAVFLSRTKREWGVECRGHRRTSPRRKATH